MRINSYQHNYGHSYPNFNGRIEKILYALQNTKNVKILKITTEDALKIYEKLGYKTSKKQGSHITITHQQGFEFSLAMPHGSEKRFIHGDSVKTLQCAVFEDLKQLIQSLHFQRR